MDIALSYRQSFSSPLGPDQLWGPPSLLSNSYQGFLPWGWVQGVKLTTHAHLAPRLTGAVCPLKSMSLNMQLMHTQSASYYILHTSFMSHIN